MRAGRDRFPLILLADLFRDAIFLILAILYHSLLNYLLPVFLFRHQG